LRFVFCKKAMFCPVCGYKQISQNVRFCSKCGFPLTEVSLLIARGGSLVAVGKERTESPRKKGLKQGLFIFLLSFLVVPMVAVLSETFEVLEVLIPISAISLFVGGILRMVYALMFESSNYSDVTGLQSEEADLAKDFHQSLFQAQTQEGLPRSEMEELKLPAMVTEETTMLFETKSPIKEKTTRFEESSSSSENFE
jgi:hypothetical protein